MVRWVGMLLATVVMVAVGSGVGIAGLRNAWFSSGTMVSGQIIRNEGDLPGETKVFDKATDKVARLFLVFGDVDSHVLGGELKGPEGNTVRTVKYDVPSITRAGISWRYTTYSFNLQNLAPAVYTLELTIDGGKAEKYSFTLK
jgi:hypothetical protein